MTAEDKIFYRRLGAKVRRERIDRGLTQEALGEMLRPKQHRASICNLEKGAHRMHASVLHQLQEILGASLLPRVGQQWKTM